MVTTMWTPATRNPIGRTTNERAIDPADPAGRTDGAGLLRRAVDRRQLLRAGGGILVAAAGLVALPTAERVAAWSFDPGSYVTPVAGSCFPVTQWYGPGTYSHNSGQNAAAIDIGTPTGTPVYAPKDGVIQWENWEGEGGIVCRINHADGLQSVLAHLNDTVVNIGDTVTGSYTLIGHSGATGNVSGPHLHWATVVQGTLEGIPMDGIPGVSPGQICP